jgi:hypothetical protein
VLCQSQTGKEEADTPASIVASELAQQLLKFKFETNQSEGIERPKTREDFYDGSAKVVETK